MYDAKKHVTKEWQMVTCGVITAASITGAFFVPIKSGEIPIVRLVAFAVAGAALTTGELIAKSKEPLDRQKMAIDAADKKVFATSLGIETALLIETKKTQSEELLVKECDKN